MANKDSSDYVPKKEDYDRAIQNVEESERDRIKRLRNPEFKRSPFEEFQEKGRLSSGLSYISGLLGDGINAVKQLPYKILGTALLGLTLSVTSGVLSYNHEYNRDSKKQLGFSEISQIIDDVTKQGLVPGEGGKEVIGMARTLYQAGLNDLAMKIIEDSNLAHENDGDYYSNFSSRLRDRLNPEKKKHKYELNELFNMVSDSSKKVREHYSNLTHIRGNLPQLSQMLNDSWTEKHNDNYHTELRMVTHTSTDSKGNITTHTTLEPHSVYDDTDHYYYYHPKKGSQASESLERLIRTSGDIRIPEPYYTAKKVNDLNREAIIKSRTEKEAPKLSENDLLGIVNTWYSGSTLVLNENQIYTGWNNLIADSKNLAAIKLTAKDYHVNTSSSTNLGPKEYQVAYKTRDQIKGLNRLLDESLSVLDSNDQNLPRLRQKINQFVEINDTKERNKLGREVLDLTQEIYHTNFKNGFEVDRFRTGMIVLWSFLGTIAGGAVGFGAGCGMDYLREKQEEQIF
ncbi:MAG: hypothetical protein WC979_06550 [Candidatus Pacearchaeota archaeon]|jgi:hypothetical protein